ncbi:hypothetical protein EC990815_5007 [Escherichia coli 99.0815]|uniref:Uncharacterized protein n=2 Tax=Escherichia coli TaxID=562 RepID=A0AAC9U9V1_ECOLX|nr:hypothetical protein EDL933_5587 [Escherichia coli O157:H7 str. EDL933]ASL61803.1 hypothetical protein FORC44_5050 [Escherichia coli]EDU68777.1 hypothetical protein ECH7EC4076_2413 [Escherichia coli O157:H7 str. EC4076]EGD70448.1 hypothetical protein ECoA_01092 [Escherichia coli O157:H7 str. 1044]EIN33981.1 hypothetical protein EC93001_5640 [Escherichia coli 93-001]EIO59880.1 hypothetical protein ECTW11039_5639 [Escherichia coli TW11039]EIO86873.1 hypothetical protein ECTW09195_5668 [Esche
MLYQSTIIATTAPHEKGAALWISGWRLRKAPENETKKPENAFPNFCG